MISILTLLALSATPQPLQDEDRLQALEETVDALLDELEDLRLQPSASDSGRLTLGGYGEIHFNNPEGGGGGILDVHRFVLYLGYAFEDWIQLHSETELEHGFVNDGDGEVSLEQLYVDFLLSDSFNVRAGRMLAPIGIINQRHEPPYFHGVERPLFDRVIVPTTWSQDGVGVFGRLSDQVSYEVQLTGGLDASGFSALSGLRGGRIKERPSFNDPALSGRVDFRPATEDLDLRFGASAWIGGGDNGNNGNDPDLNADIKLFSVDFEANLGRLGLRGAVAQVDIDGADDVLAATGQSVGDELLGGMLEASYRFMPDSWKTGRLANADAALFVRYDTADTQAEISGAAVYDGAAEREEITVGLTFWPTQSFALKADFQFRDDEAGNDAGQFNLGLGWVLD